MRKVFWCCLGAGAVACCAVGAVAYISQNPNSPVSRVALAAAKVSIPAPAHSGQVAVVEADDFIPPDPVPVGELPPLPAPGSHVPPAVAALMASPPIIIHDEEELNIGVGPIAKAQPASSGHVDAETRPPATVDIHSVSQKQDVGPLVMPYCADESTAPTMPYCADDEAAPPSGGDKDMSKTEQATHQEFDTFAFWMGFFSGPAHIVSDPSGARWQEDAHYAQQYSGAPYTTRQTPAEQPVKVDPKVVPVSGVEDPTEPPTPKTDKPHDQTRHAPHLQMKRMVEPASDTMEIRPGDWKPYGLEPGPY